MKTEIPLLSLLVIPLMVLGGLPAGAQTYGSQAARASPNPCNMAQLGEEIRANPRNVNAYITRAACNLNSSPGGNRKPPLHNVEAAVPDLETALKLDPQNCYAHHNYAQAAYLLGFDDYAIGEYTKAIALNPRGGRSYLGRGWAYSNVCQMNDAAADFAQALRFDPSLRSEVESPQQIAQRRIECSRPPPTVHTPQNCPKAHIFAFSINAKFLLESEWRKRHPGCPL